LISAGEETGDLPSVFRQLIKYLSWVDDLQSKIKKATTQPKIAGLAVVVMLVVMLGYVVPQIVGFIESLDQELPFYTIALMATSEFFQAYWKLLLIGPVVAFFLVKFLKKISDQVAYSFDLMVLNMPIFGDLTRKASIARYAQTFGALYASGIDVLGSLRAAKKTVTNRALVRALDSVEEYVQAGSAISEAFEASGQFPSLVTRMIRVGEGSGNLTPVLQKVTEFYARDVDEAVEGLVAMIQPTLTAVMGGLILWIAVSVFGPIYSSFENIDF
jgi:type IV pilus assembly protein PilC